MKLSILEYLKYLGGTDNSKCVIEGENVLDDGHLLLAGKTKESSETIDIYGLCLQSSSLECNPHEIKGRFTLNSSVNIDHMLCSCKAGNSGKCKHVSAFLIKCIREDIELLEFISQANLKHFQETQKTTTKDVPLCEMPCFAGKLKQSNIHVDKNKILDFFCDKLPDSALARHRKGRHCIPK